MGHCSDCFENWGYSPNAHNNYERIKKLTERNAAMQEQIETMWDEITRLKHDINELKQNVRMLLLEMKGDDK